jgi:hypothetical protein
VRERRKGRRREGEGDGKPRKWEGRMRKGDDE